MNIGQYANSVNDFVWHTEAAELPWWKAWAIGVLRMIYALGRDLAEGQLTLRAMSLVYTTLLSIVPLLAVSFSVLKAFGVHNQIEPVLRNVLAPLGRQGNEISVRIIEFVENMQVGVLGTLGLAFLFLTVISLMQKIEQAFNLIWNVSADRPLTQRFSDYLSVILIGPVLVFSALGIMASLMNAAVVQQVAAIGPMDELVDLASKLLPYLLIVAAFTFIYIFIPNTRVWLTSALIGGAVAGLLWQSIGWVFATFIANSTQYKAVYSAFATLIVFMIWIYLAWLILLIGASIAFYHQNPVAKIVPPRALRLSNRLKEQIALQAMHLIGRNYYQDHPAWNTDDLAKQLNVPVSAAERVLIGLREHGLLTCTADQPPRWLPAAPLDTTPIKTLLDAIRAVDERAYLKRKRLPCAPAVTEIVGQLDHASDQALAGRTLKDLALDEHAAPALKLAKAPEESIP